MPSQPDRLVALHREPLNFASLLRRQIGGKHRARLVEQVLVFVVVEFARRQDFARDGGDGLVVAQHGAFEFAALRCRARQ